MHSTLDGLNLDAFGSDVIAEKVIVVLIVSWVKHVAASIISKMMVELIDIN